jgi:suppressor of cytokine signaling 2
MARTQSELSECGWYHASLSWQESSMLLQNTQEGTFLVRDSQNQGFLYSLSVQRAKEGPTSVRIHFSQAKFRLDAEEKIRDLMPQFSSVGQLVQHYVTSSRKPFNRDVFVDQSVTNSKVHSPIVLRWPLYKQPPSLAHLTRMVINARIQEHVNYKPIKSMRDNLADLELPAKLVDYLHSYQLTV